jgi:hypothetical protein
MDGAVPEAPLDAFQVGKQPVAFGFLELGHVFGVLAELRLGPLGPTPDIAT